MVARGDIHWVNFPEPVGRRPGVIVTRSEALPILNAYTFAPISRKMRGIASYVPVGQDEGLPEESAITCDNLLTVRKVLADPERIGHLGPFKSIELDNALQFALGISS